jgi:hypothetical protein
MSNLERPSLYVCSTQWIYVPEEDTFKIVIFFKQGKVGSHTTQLPQMAVISQKEINKSFPDGVKSFDRLLEAIRDKELKINE